MQIGWIGHSCFRIITEHNNIVTDPYNEETGYKLPSTPADIVTVSHSHFDHSYAQCVAPGLVISDTQPRTINGDTIWGIPCWHDDVRGAKRGSNIVYVIDADGQRIVHLGDLGHLLNDKDIEKLGKVDVLLLPVGGIYTLCPKTCVELCEKIKPRIIVPMHYACRCIRFRLGKIDKYLTAAGYDPDEVMTQKVEWLDPATYDKELAIMEQGIGM